MARSIGNRRRVWAALAVGVALAACSTELLGPDFELEFARSGGCGDVYFFAVDDEDEVMLTFYTRGLVAQAVDAGVETTSTFPLPDAGVTLLVEQGSRISDATCDDVVEQGGPRVARTWVAVGGLARVTIRPGPDDFSARGDLLLENVVLEDGDGNRRVVERYAWNDVAVGWLPG